MDVQNWWTEVANCDPLNQLIHWRLQQQEAGQRLLSSIPVTLPSEGKQAGREAALFCDAMNRALGRLRKLCTGAGSGLAACAASLEQRADAVVAVLNWSVQRPVSAGVAEPCQELVNLFAGQEGLQPLSERWLREERALAGRPSDLEERLEWLAREVLCIEDVRVGALVRVKKEADVVLGACRSCGVGRGNDSLRLAALGKAVRVLAVDAGDGTVQCRVANVGEIWFGVGGLAPATGNKKGNRPTTSAAAAASSAAAASKAKELCTEAFQKVVQSLQDITQCVLPGDATTRDEVGHVQTWLEGLAAGGDPGKTAGVDLGKFDLSKVRRTSPVTATWLLHELRAAFAADSFQWHFQELQSRAESSFSSCHMEMLALTSGVQYSILPRYGFDATPKGVMDMKEEMEFHSVKGDAAVSRLVCDIHFLLGKRDVQVSLPLHGQEQRRRLHTVGDSHSVYGWPSCVVQHHQGPILCHNVDRIDVQHLAVQAGDAVCFCLGEIDCRCHVLKHCVGGATFRHVIDGLVTRYFRFLQASVPLLPPAVMVCVYNVVPPVRAQALQREEKMAYPFNGSDEERREYVLYFNRRLQAECSRAGYIYFDVYESYVDAEGFLAAELSDGSVHIQDGRHLASFMAKTLGVT